MSPSFQQLAVKPLVFEGEIAFKPRASGHVLESNRIEVELEEEPARRTLEVCVSSYNHEPEGSIPERHPELIAFANKRVRVTVEVIEEKEKAPPGTVAEHSDVLLDLAKQDWEALLRARATAPCVCGQQYRRDECATQNCTCRCHPESR